MRAKAERGECMSYSRKRVREKFKPKSEKLMDQVREVLRFHHYAYRTEQTYVSWILRYIKFHGKVHPNTLGQPDVENFLSYLAQVDNVAASTQNQAFNSILFLYKHVLDLPERVEHIDAVRAKKPRKMPTVLTCDEVKALFAELDGTSLMIAKLMYGWLRCGASLLAGAASASLHQLGLRGTSRPFALSFGKCRV